MKRTSGASSVGLTTQADSLGAATQLISANENGEMGAGCALAQQQVRTLSLAEGLGCLSLY